MKRSFILMLHLFYWMVYYGLLTMLFGLSTISRPHATGQFAYWNMLILGFAIIPAILTFYSTYGSLFRHFLASRRIPMLIITLAALCLLGVGFGQALLHSLFPHRINWSGGTVISMGIVMFFNAALNGMAGLGIKAFITWYRELK